MKARRDDNGIIRINCPGCGTTHGIDDRWQFNGDGERPTFSPSLLVRSGHYVTGQTREQCASCSGGYKACGVCHSFIRDGKIQFLGDCTHALAGQTVDLPDCG